MATRGAVGLVFATVIQGMPLADAWLAAPLGWNVSLFLACIGHATLTTTAFKRRSAVPLAAGAPIVQPA